MESAMKDNSLYMFDKSIVSSRLIRWGKWKMTSGVALGYPTKAAFVGLSPNPPGDWCGQSIDSECVQTNDAVEQLTLFQQVVVRVEYISGHRETAVKADVCGISKRRYYEYLNLSHEQIAEKLNLLLIRPHASGINVLSC